MERPPVPYNKSAPAIQQARCEKTYVTTGKVTTLEHELRDDTVEAGALVSLTLRGLAELTEVASGLGDIGLVEAEGNTGSLGCTENLVRCN